MSEKNRPDPEIYEIKETVDVNSGRQIVMLTSIDLEPKIINVNDSDAFVNNVKKVVFRGLAPIMTNQGPNQFPFIFPEEFKTLKQCWESFDEVAHSAIKKMQEEQKHKIIIPGRE